MAEINDDVAAEVIGLLPEELLRVCLFSLGEDVYAIPVDTLTEIIISQKIFPVPTTPAHVLGVINLRGNIIPVVDIRPVLGLDRTSVPTQMAILKHDSVTIGIVVHNVSEVISIPFNTVLAMPSYTGTGSKPGSRFVKSVIQREEGVASLLDVEAILHEIRLG